jgi:hypothetical protein
MTMGRRIKSQEPTGPRPNDSWVYSEEIQVNGRNVTHGTELKIAGQRGRFRFLRHVKTETTEWVDVWGGPKGAENWRSYSLDKIKRVHYKNRTVENLAVEYKQKMKDKKAETNADSQED